MGLIKSLELRGEGVFGPGQLGNENSRQWRGERLERDSGTMEASLIKALLSLLCECCHI